MFIHLVLIIHYYYIYVNQKYAYTLKKSILIIANHILMH